MMTDADISLRPANLTDAQILARLWTTTFADKFGPALGQNAEAVLCDWFRLSRRHLQTTTLAEVDGAVAGFIVLETPTSPRPDDGRWLWRALQLHNGLFGALRGMLVLLLLENDQPRATDEVYIEMLGVDDAWRGRGVANCLLHYAQTVARQQQATSLSLSVMTDNLQAIRLYAKLGFKIKSKRRSRILQWVTGHPGVYEMVRPVEGKL
jgi:ribosomal protein S18 acetylase RimI-like enzyme